MRQEYFETREILKRILKGIQVKSVLDIGGGSAKKKKIDEVSESAYYRDLLPRDDYISIDLDKTSELPMDLNKIKRLPFQPRSKDIVIFSMNIEHLYNPIPVCKEVARIAKRYILFGAPNMMAWDSRVLFLLGKVNGMSLISDYTGHHHLWRKELTDDVAKSYFKSFRIVKSIHHGFYKGGSLLPFSLRLALADLRPTLFSSMSFHLFERK